MNKIYSFFYKWLLVSETLFFSIMSISSTNNYSLREKLKILSLVHYFYYKAIVNELFRMNIQSEKFLQYTTFFPNYTEFVLLFISLFCTQDYRLKIKNVHTVVDLGSNWGMSILYFKYFHPNSKIIAIEANRKTVDYLKKNIVVNKLDNVKVYIALISGTTGMRDFYISKDTWSISDTAAADSVGKRGDFVKIKVKTILFSKFIQEKIDVVKIDIEGMEGEALKEAESYLKNVSEFVLEYHSILNMKHNSIRKIKQMLNNAGFIIEISAISGIIPRKENRKLRIIHAFKKTGVL